MQGAKPVAAARIGQLFDDDLLPTDVVIIHTAVALLGPHHKKALLASLFEYVAIHHTLLAEPLHVGHYLFREKSPIGLPKHHLLFRKLPGEHVALLMLR